MCRMRLAWNMWSQLLSFSQSRSPLGALSGMQSHPGVWLPSWVWLGTDLLTIWSERHGMLLYEAQCLQSDWDGRGVGGDQFPQIWTMEAWVKSKNGLVVAAWIQQGHLLAITAGRESSSYIFSIFFCLMRLNNSPFLIYHFIDWTSPLFYQCPIPHDAV
jgi:hypothetical protein